MLVHRLYSMCIAFDRTTVRDIRHKRLAMRGFRNCYGYDVDNIINVSCMHVHDSTKHDSCITLYDCGQDMKKYQLACAG